MNVVQTEAGRRCLQQPMYGDIACAHCYERYGALGLEAVCDVRFWTSAAAAAAYGRSIDEDRAGRATVHARSPV